MNIIAAMAAAAGRRHRDRQGSRRRPLVAGEALQAIVGAVEDEIGLNIVIELPDQPVVGVVAGPATQPQPAVMDVVFPMAIDALILGVVESVSAQFVPATSSAIFSFMLFIIVMFWRPRGLMGVLEQ